MELCISEHIIARKLAIPDTRPIFTAVDANRELLRKWLPWVDFNTSSKDTRDFIRDSLNGYNNGTSLNLGIFDIQSSKYLGVCGYHTIKDGIAILGYWLDKDYQGSGIIFKTCQALIEHTKTNFPNIKEIRIKTAVENYKSQANAKKLGFEYKETISNAEWLYDHYVDHAVYILKLK